jgi:hypothetical protein
MEEAVSSLCKSGTLRQVGDDELAEDSREMLGEEKEEENEEDESESASWMCMLSDIAISGEMMSLSSQATHTLYVQVNISSRHTEPRVMSMG